MIVRENLHHPKRRDPSVAPVKVFARIGKEKQVGPCQGNGGKTPELEAI